MQGAGFDLLRFSFFLQALILAAGGGIACLNSIYSEKQQNTFDYQRVTRLTALELTLGKLFGAPLWMYFVCLCLVPMTVFGAVIGGVALSHILAAYAVLLVASIAYHAFALLLSLLTVRGSQLSSIVLALLLLWFVSIDTLGSQLRLHPLGPFWAREIAASHVWWIDSPSSGWDPWWLPLTDLFWGLPVPHVVVLLIVDLVLVFWFLLAVVRNIKRDAQYYELYSPLQFLGLAAFLNVLLVSFYDTKSNTALDTQSLFLTFNIVILSLLGIVLLRSRERTRSLLRSANHVSFGWIAAWPAPVLGLAALFAGALISGRLYLVHAPAGEWNFHFSLLRSLFFVLWILRDLQFLQLMNLRPGKHPLVMGFLYLSIYYVCASLFLGAIGAFRAPEASPFTSLFLPSPIFLLDSTAWSQAPSMWMLGFIIRPTLLGLFLFRQRTQIRLLAPAVPSVS